MGTSGTPSQFGRMPFGVGRSVARGGDQPDRRRHGGSHPQPDLSPGPLLTELEAIA